MDAAGHTICLCMIVKNEANVIERCLSSVISLVDYWAIIDTGSNDHTQTIVKSVLKDLPGKIIKRPWRNFAFNRSESLRLAQTHGDYTLVMDADDRLVLPDGFQLPALRADSYSIDILFDDIRYHRTLLVKNSLDWRYKGVVHEFIECPDAQTSGHLSIQMIVGHDGARRRNPQTYKNDAAILIEALKTEQDPFLVARYTFYLAQSYFDAGDYTLALDKYTDRAGQGFWDDEVFYSLFRIGVIREQLGHALDSVVEAYMVANEMAPRRAEPLHAASRACRLAGEFERGYVIAEKGLALEAPAVGLFVLQPIYDYRLLDEYAVCAYWTGRYRVCLEATLRAMQTGTVPAAEQPRMLQNMRFALDKI